MNRLRIARRPSPALLVSLFALALSATGTAYAVSSIDGKLIKKNSIPANRIKRHALGGAQINVKSLGVVPSAATAATATSATTAQSAQTAQTAATASNAHEADLLGGVAASGFMQGGGSYLSKAFVFATADSHTIATIAGIGQLIASCSPSSSVSLDYDNTTGDPVDVAVWTWLLGPPTPYAFRAPPIAAGTSISLSSTGATLTMSGGTAAGTIDVTLTGDVAADGRCHVYLTGTSTLAVS